MIRVAVVDDHPHVAIALRALLDETPDIQLVAESRRGSDVAALVRRTRPDVLLLDLFIEPEFDALAAVRRLRADFPDLKICLLSACLGHVILLAFQEIGEAVRSRSIRREALANFSVDYEHDHRSRLITFVIF